MPKGSPTHEHDGLERHNINKKHTSIEQDNVIVNIIAPGLINNLLNNDVNPNIVQVTKPTLEDDLTKIIPDTIQIPEILRMGNKSNIVTITRLNLDAKIEETKLGLDLFLLSDIELHNGLTTQAKTGIMIDIPDGYFGVISLDDEVASNGAIMVGSPKYIYGKQEIMLYVTAMVGNYFEFRKGRKIAQLIIQKNENVKYEYK